MSIAGPLPKFAPKALCLDIETAADDRLDLRKLAAWRPDTGAQIEVANLGRTPDLAEQLDALTEGAVFVLGHNLVQHDLPVLRQRLPQLRLHALPAVDTLILSPIAFPQNPYHSLVKDYKLVRDARSSPLKDAQLALKLWQDQFDAFAALKAQSPQELACHHFLLTRDPALGYGSFFATVRRAVPPPAGEVRERLLALTAGKVCATRIGTLVDDCLAEPALALPLAYLLAWLRVSGGNSVLPPWVRLNYPQVRELLRQLRETPCDAPDCAYCRTYLDARRELSRYFGFDAFRPEPANADGDSLQEDIVNAAYAGRSILAILPTGGGKSICYQLPALSRHWRSGSLTIIVSPLQSLMKDQVDNLVRQGIFSAATLNGMLSLPERRDVLDKTRLGDVGILLVSPEQFRNPAFAEAIRHREIGAWVYDEAHCLSKWGQDFRPDYLYVSRFIRERSRDRLAPVWCFTATAKREVVKDLRQHFHDALGIELDTFDGGHERHNLHYEVMQVGTPEKSPEIHRLLQRELDASPGGAVVFAASRKRCEEIDGFLRDMGWPSAHFHAGLDPGVKKEVQRAFIAGDLRVIVATNAFGMGVDKPDVRIVIHADIPGSLENYLQEAGRAGRDRQDSRCVLLYDEADVETQFGLAARSQLSRRDIAGILRALRRYSARTKSTEVVVTPGEILADDDIDTSIEAENPDADTKVRTAIAWLERARFVQRDENHTRVFPGSLRIGSLAEAEKRLARADLSDDMRRRHLELVGALINADDDEGISTDTLMLQLGLPSQDCIRMLHQLEQLGIVSNDLALTVLLRKGVKDASAARFERLAQLESALLDLLPELAPDADAGSAAGSDWQDMNLRGLCQELKTRAALDFRPDELLTLMRSLARPFGSEEAGRRAMFDVRLLRRELLRVRLLRPWRSIREIGGRRRAVAAVLLQNLLARLDGQPPGVDLRVACSMAELGAALRTDTEVGPGLKDEMRAIEAGLLYLHDNGVLIIDRGKSVFRSAMTIRIRPEEKGRRFSASDFEPLKEHYSERTFQVHVIQEYARLGLRKLSDALAFVLAYFTLPRITFTRRYFAGRREMLERATTEESWRRIVEDLRHPLQEAIVSAKADGNRLILAGPGSGKTRVIVHRVAYLVRVAREPARGILVLAYNRAAAAEIRQRLRALAGADAAGVTVLTYHALALRLTGTSLAGLATQGAEANFDAILDRALALLEGRGEDANDGDELRERLLAGYRHILVDEYQDIDARQYGLIAALAGRRLADGDARLTLLAVGDDDQNIYAFRHTSNEFIQRFQTDYEAGTDYLVENYRSTAHIIAAANAVIAGSPGRLKADHSIRINHARRNDAPGGRWARLDAIAGGRVQVLAVPRDLRAQAAIVMAALSRLKALDSGADWSEFAVLARNRASLAPIRAWCELEGVPYCSSERDASQPRLHQTREARALLDLLNARPRRRLCAAALLRWFARRFGGTGADDPWLGLLAEFLDELHTSWPEGRVPTGIVIEALYEFGNEARRSERGRLVLSTVHGAKGREFRHVALLDGGDWRSAAPDERRLYYVGMTRARDNLVLCEGSADTNPFSPALGGEGLLRAPLPAQLDCRPELGRLYLAPGLADVDLGFAGRQPAGHPVHRAIDLLRHGDSLQWLTDNGRHRLVTSSGIVVGRLAARFNLPPGQVLRVTVAAIVHRTRAQIQDSQWRDAAKVEEWWVVLPEIVLAPCDLPTVPG